MTCIETYTKLFHTLCRLEERCYCSLGIRGVHMGIGTCVKFHTVCSRHCRIFGHPGVGIDEHRTADARSTQVVEDITQELLLSNSVPATVRCQLVGFVGDQSHL